MLPYNLSQGGTSLPSLAAAAVAGTFICALASALCYALVWLLPIPLTAALGTGIASGMLLQWGLPAVRCRQRDVALVLGMLTGAAAVVGGLFCEKWTFDQSLLQGHNDFWHQNGAPRANMDDLFDAIALTRTERKQAGLALKPIHSYDGSMLGYVRMQAEYGLTFGLLGLRLGRNASFVYWALELLLAGAVACLLAPRFADGTPVCASCGVDCRAEDLFAGDRRTARRLHACLKSGDYQRLTALRRSSDLPQHVVRGFTCPHCEQALAFLQVLRRGPNRRGAVRERRLFGCGLEAEDYAALQEALPQPEPPMAAAG